MSTFQQQTRFVCLNWGGGGILGVCFKEALSSEEFWKQVIYLHGPRLDLLKSASNVDNGTEYFNQIHFFLTKLK